VEVVKDASGARDRAARTSIRKTRGATRRMAGSVKATLHWSRATAVPAEDPLYDPCS